LATENTEDSEKIKYKKYKAKLKKIKEYSHRENRRAQRVLITGRCNKGIQIIIIISVNKNRYKDYQTNNKVSGFPLSRE